MALAEYVKAYKLGKKEYQARILQEQNPTLPVLDEILPTRGTFSEVPLGLVQIPMVRLWERRRKEEATHLQQISCRF